jgi:hypothetical protein
MTDPPRTRQDGRESRPKSPQQERPERKGNQAAGTSRDAGETGESRTSGQGQAREEGGWRRD